MDSAKKILILSSNPKDTGWLRLDEEIREIQEGLKRSSLREQFIIKPSLAVGVRHMRRELLDYEPDIVHFCGHGEEEGLLLENNQGKAVLVPSEAIASLFSLFKDQVECVLLNSCYSHALADGISQHIPYVIGMKIKVSDEAAIEFSVGFYDALGAGKTIEESFKYGCNAIHMYNLPEELTPVIHVRSITAAPEKPEPPVPSLKDSAEITPGKCPMTYSQRPQVLHFVDRDEIRAKLRADLRDEKKVFVIVDGLAGIGKTSLAAKIAEEVEADFEEIYWTKCSGETDLDQLLTELAYFLSGCGDNILSGVVEYPAPPASKINFLLTALAKQKYLLIFDDVHELLSEECQVENEGLSLLFSSLLEMAHQSKILLVSRVRPVLPRHALCQAKNRLEPVDPESGLELLRLLGLEEDEELLRRAWKLTDGHPLAMELLAGMAEDNDLALILADKSLFYSNAGVVSQLLRHFYTMLNVEEKGLLLRMSVLPRPANFEIISHLEENGQTQQLLSSLIGKNLVTYDRKTKLYRLHDLVREFSRAEMSAEERKDCHVRMAAYYEQLEFNPDKPTFDQVQQRLEAHYHAFQAGDVVGAAGLLVPIAEYLRKWGYLERCGTLLEESLAALENLEPTIENFLLRVDLLVETGWLERSSEGLDKAVARCRQAEEILQTAPDEGREGKVCHALGKFLYEEALWDEAEEYFTRAFAIQKSQRDTRQLAKVLYDLYLLYWNVGELEKIEAISRKGIKVCEQEGDAASKCKILMGAALFLQV